VADECRQISMQSAKISGTPTLILVNTSGVVDKVWVGKLSSPAAKCCPAMAKNLVNARILCVIICTAMDWN
jgi:hypothetical protein